MKLKPLAAALLALAFTVPIMPGSEGVGRTQAQYPVSSQYSAGVYYSNLMDADLTGDLRRDYVNVALSQAGYHEGNSVSDLGGGNLNGWLDYTEYGYWFGTQVQDRGGLYSPWCAIFAAWCARQAFIPVSVISNAAYARIGVNPYHFHMEYRAKGEYLPKSGDLIFYDFTGTGEKWSHVGIVAYVEKDRVVTVEGNMDKQVRMFRRPLNSSIIRGYGVPAYASPDTRAFDLSYYTPPTAALYPGASGAGIGWLQCALLHLGYPCPVDGSFGDMTTAQVRAFQRDNGINATGNCGSLTRAALHAKLAERQIEPVSPSQFPVPVRTLRCGDSGTDVMWLQAALRIMGFDAHTTGYFGELTLSRVKLLQRTWGITPTGVLGPVTREKLQKAVGGCGLYVQGQLPTQYPVPTRTLKKGNSGSDVKWLQHALKALGCSRLTGTGYFGDLTEEYVRLFQSTCGLPVNGVFDKTCRDRLIALFDN